MSFSQILSNISNAGGAASAVASAAPSNPSVGDVWFDSVGDPPLMYVYTGTEDGWVVISPNAQVPDRPTTNGTYNLVVERDGDGVSWVAAESGGGSDSGGGGGAATAWSTVQASNFGGSWTLPAGGTYRCIFTSTSSGRTLAFQSGFSNLIGGWYRYANRGDADGTSTDRGFAQWIDSGFDIFEQPGAAADTTFSYFRCTGDDDGTATTQLRGQNVVFFEGAGGFIEAEFIVGDGGDAVIKNSSTIGGAALTGFFNVRASIARIA